MESSTQVSAGEEPALHAKPRGAARQQDPIDKPARRLGPKRSALQRQRHRKVLATWHAGVTGSGSSASAQLLASSDGALEFAIHRVPTGLMIEKRLWRPSGPRTAQTLFFRDAAGFDRWCELEPVRFEDPLLYGELRRQGHDALGKR